LIRCPFFYAMHPSRHSMSSLTTRPGRNCVSRLECPNTAGTIAAVRFFSVGVCSWSRVFLIDRHRSSSAILNVRVTFLLVPSAYVLPQLTVSSSVPRKMCRLASSPSRDLKFSVTPLPGG
jgi:hypothetical protein